MIFQIIAVFASQPPRSITWGQVILSFEIAFFHASSLSSSDIPSISNPLSLYLGYNLTNPLLEVRQGPHHDAQKSINTTFPFIEERRIVSPFEDGNAISSAIIPWRGCA